MVTISVKYEGRDVELELQPITYGDYKKIRHLALKFENGQFYRDIDLIDELEVIKCIIKAPFDIIKSNLDKLSKEDGLKLEFAVHALNGIKND